MSVMVEMTKEDANNLDEVVHELGIEDSFTTPVEAVRKLKADNERLRSAFNLAHGALLCIGHTDSNWSEYARNVAHEAGAIML